MRDGCGRPRRVAFVVDSTAWGGAEVWARHHLRRSTDHGWVASLVCTDAVAAGFDGVLPPERVEVVTPCLGAEDAPGLRAALVRQRPDVVVLNLVDPSANRAAARAAQSVAPTVGVLHLVGDTGRGPAHQALRAVYRGYAALVSPSREGRDQLVTGLGVPAGRTVVVPNGVDVPARPTGPAGAHPPVLGAVGRLTDQKGFDLLLQAVAALVDRGTALQVVIAGAGRREADLREQARGLPVSLAGFVRDVPAFLTGLDLFCLPSRVEALPLALLEAMAAGLPCVASDVGDVRAAVGDGAVVVPVGDVPALVAALETLLGDAAARAALGRRARAVAERDLDAGLMVRRTFEVLEHVAAGARPSGAPPPAPLAAPSRA